MPSIDSIERRHGTAVSLLGYGILLLGDSGAGKSSLAARLIANHNAVLIADDVVELSVVNHTIILNPASSIAGMIELYGIGLIRLPYVHSIKLDLVVQCAMQAIERLPERIKWLNEGIATTQVTLNAHHASAPDKILLLVRALQSDDLIKT